MEKINKPISIKNKNKQIENKESADGKS